MVESLHKLEESQAAELSRQAETLSVIEALKMIMELAK